MFPRPLPGEHACDLLGLRHAADAQRARRCPHCRSSRPQQIGLAQAQLAADALARAADPCARTPREAD